jgi:hypothetical protein
MNKLREDRLKPVGSDRIIDDLGPSPNLYWMEAEMEDYELLMHVLERNHPYDRALMRDDEMCCYRHEYDPGGYENWRV